MISIVENFHWPLFGLDHLLMLRFSGSFWLKFGKYVELDEISNFKESCVAGGKGGVRTATEREFDFNSVVI